MANSASISITKTAAQTSAILESMAEDMRATVLEGGVKALCRPIEIAAKRFAKRSERTGALRESITTKTKAYKKDGKAVGLVGPDKSYYRGGKKAGKLEALLGADRPANYAHLIEYGHHAVAPKKGTTLRKKTATAITWVPAKPFLRPAATTTSAEQSSAFFEAIGAGIDRAFKRVSKSA